MMDRKMKLGYTQTDFLGNWKLSDMFTEFANIATAHATSFGGWDPKYIDQYGWVIAKMRVKVHQPIHMDDEVVVRTWITQGSAVVHPRQYEIVNEKGDVIVEATSNWTLIDLVRRRIAIPKRVGLTFPEEICKPGTIEIETDFNDEEGYTFVEKRQVRYGDIDVNGHLNNAKYVEWVCDCLGYDVFKENFIEDLSIQFKKETGPNEYLVLEKKCEGNTFKVRGLDEEGNLHFMAEGNLKKYESEQV